MAQVPRTGGIRSFYESLKAQQAAGSKVQSAVIGLRQNAEGGATGALLGYAEGKLGTLDIAGKYPADALAAIVCYLLSVRNSDGQDGFATDLRAISQSCFTVFMYRKGKLFGEGKLTITGQTIHNDPIVNAAKVAGL